MNNKDKSRFVTLTALAKLLGKDSVECKEIASQANAIMTIGQRTWYEKDKIQAYLNSNKENKKEGNEVNEMKEIPQIEWFGKLSHGGSRITNDVKITLDKDGRLRVAIDKNKLSTIKIGKKMMLGISGDKMYFVFSDEGYAVNKSKENTGIVSIQCKARGTMVDFVGEYPIHIGLNGLFNVDLKERVQSKTK